MAPSLVFRRWQESKWSLLRIVKYPQLWEGGITHT